MVNCKECGRECDLVMTRSPTNKAQWCMSCQSHGRQTYNYTTKALANAAAVISRAEKAKTKRTEPKTS